MTFESASAVQPGAAPGQLLASPDSSWLQNPLGVYGGLSGAIVLRAFQHAAPGYSPRTVTLQLCAPVPAAPLVVNVRTERAGAKTVFLSAQICAAAEPTAVLGHAMATFGLPRKTDLDLAGVAPPLVPPPDSIASFVSDTRVLPPFLQNIDIRFCRGAAPFSGSTETALSAWLAFVEPPAHADAAACAALLDVVFANALARATAPRRMTSVSLEWRFLAPVPAPAPAHLLLDAVSLSMFEGYADQEARLFASGRCVAILRQMFALLD